MRAMEPRERFTSRFGRAQAWSDALASILAGAVAFALWEPLAYLVLERAPTGRSFFAFVEGQGGEQAKKPAYIRILGIAEILPEFINTQHIRVEPHCA